LRGVPAKGVVEEIAWAGTRGVGATLSRAMPHGCGADRLGVAGEGGVEGAALSADSAIPDKPWAVSGRRGAASAFDVVAQAASVFPWRWRRMRERQQD
jgi:hypothetical protein